MLIVKILKLCDANYLFDLSLKGHNPSQTLRKKKNQANSTREAKYLTLNVFTERGVLIEEVKLELLWKLNCQRLIMRFFREWIWFGL